MVFLEVNDGSAVQSQSAVAVTLVWAKVCWDGLWNEDMFSAWERQGFEGTTWKGDTSWSGASGQDIYSLPGNHGTPMWTMVLTSIAGMFAQTMLEVV